MQFLCAFLRTAMGRFLSTRDAKIISIVINVMHQIVVHVMRGSSAFS